MSFKGVQGNKVLIASPITGKVYQTSAVLPAQLAGLSPKQIQALIDTGQASLLYPSYLSQFPWLAGKI